VGEIKYLVFFANSGLTGEKKKIILITEKDEVANECKTLFQCEVIKWK
jgi:hypothetical protein